VRHEFSEIKFCCVQFLCGPSSPRYFTSAKIRSLAARRHAEVLSIFSW
jgi:hypothetical protein